MKFKVETTLTCITDSTIELPINSWAEIKYFFVKWDTLHYTVDGKIWLEVALNSNTDDIVDWKRPASVSIYSDEGYDEIANYSL